jgi:hypothetical protein
VRTKEGKKNVKKAIILAALMLAVADVGAYAQQSVMDRSKVTLSTTAGTCTWTQNVEVANVQLVRIGVKAGLYATDTVTVARVTGETIAETNTVVAMILASGSAGSNLTHAINGAPVYLKRNDKLTFTSGSTTGATAYIEYLIQTR